MTRTVARTPNGRPPQLPAESERDWQTAVRNAAALYRWKVQVTWRSVHSPAGWPDLFMVRGNRIIAAELKADQGVVTLAQQKWLDVLSATGKVETYVWRPSDWNQVLEVLR